MDAALATVAEAARPPAPPRDRWCDWDRFVAQNPSGGFMQTSWWADFRAESGYRH